MFFLKLGEKNLQKIPAVLGGVGCDLDSLKLDFLQLCDFLFLGNEPMNWYIPKWSYITTT